MIALRTLAKIALLSSLASCTSVGERTLLSVGYYDIKGSSFSELDQQILLHGPTVKGVGKALAATRIKMVPDIRFAQKGGKCFLTKTRVNVKARVTLPRLANQRRLKKGLRRAWRNLEEYARLHEAVHVAIADHHALEIEKALAAMPPADNCETLKTNARILAAKLLEKHELDQLKFDATEKKRIKSLTVERTKVAELKP
ncbi:MAG: hypothetical protein COB78_01890 [Hyphomicrobiales bacterium]|nr:MAG: hypothetical protein COB78_01890 [Hyphomicrobiales bacterium]